MERIDLHPDLSLPLLVAFVETYEAGSFTGAARRLHVRPAAVSRAVAKLEAALGVSLFRRTTRQFQPTVHAERYVEDVRAALTRLADAEAALRGPAVPRGRVRLSVPTTWGLHRVLPSLGALAAALPGVELDVHVGNQVVDFVREGYDLAVRLGPIEDASLVSRRLGTAALGLFASPTYVEARGRPRTLSALRDHALLPFVLPRSGRVLPWLFAGPDESFVPDGVLRCHDDVQGAVALARGGAGICQIYRFMVEDSIAAGDLVELLPARAGRTRTFHLVHPRQGLSPAARAVAEEILARRAR